MRRPLAESVLLEAIERITARVSDELRAHQERDEGQFAAVNERLTEIGADVKSLLQSRSYIRGAWKAVAVVSGATATVVSIVIAILKHFGG
jgi:hypothetical protein